MPYLPDDILKITLFQQYLGQEVINTLFYKISTVSGPDPDQTYWDFLSNELIDQFVPCQSGALLHYRQLYENLTDGVTFDESFESVAGQLVAGEAGPSFLAVNMTKTGFSKITRKGSIRIAGIGESAFNGNALEPIILTPLDTLGNYLESFQTWQFGMGAALSVQPIIVGRLPTGGFDLARINAIDGIGNPKLSTQNSRKA